MKYLAAGVMFLFTCSVQTIGLTADIQGNTELDSLFTDAGVNGTFVLYDVLDDRFVMHNPIRARTRFIPASTFKIPNSLIGLSLGVVKDTDELIPYGGQPQWLKVWEQDMGLRDAIKVSNVPVYQELARRIGIERMRDNLAVIAYGNGDTGTIVDAFWLEGPLKISAVEQTEFLARLAQGTLPFSSEVQKSVREIVRLDHDGDWVLYGKTGWTTTPTPDIGWWVGWVAKDKRIYSFALNIDMPDKGDVAKRIELGRASLEILGIIQNTRE